MTAAVRNPHPLEFLFHPRSIAVVGVSSNPDGFANLSFLQPLIDSRFPGPLYPVNPHGGVICGLKAYKSIREVPPPLDHVIVSIPKAFVPGVMTDCAAQGVRTVSMFTAGFADSGDESGRELGQQVLSIARSAGIRVIGPNCVGIYCPASGLSFNSALPRDGGGVAFISQSGRYAQEFAATGARRGLRFSKVISYGNASDLNESDFMDYLAHDPETRLAAAYIEGARDGRRLCEALGAASQRKPVLIVKGGSSPAGARTAATHTSSLAGSEALWDALFLQSRAGRAESLEDLMDAVLAFSLMKPPQGRGVAIIGGGGGASVLAADACTRAGLNIPELSLELQAKLRGTVPEAGTSVRNPVDFAPGMLFQPRLFSDTIRLSASSPDVHTLIVHVVLGIPGRADADMWEALTDAIVDAGKACGRPLMLVTGDADNPPALEVVASIRRKCNPAGFPAYATMGQAIRALSHVVKCYC
ncbi:MAG: CoA-binding protein [Chloroflexi bacterium]|nr:CoA-binding protein [Chloroflexota bacterium]